MIHADFKQLKKFIKCNKIQAQAQNYVVAEFSNKYQILLNS